MKLKHLLLAVLACFSFVAQAQTTDLEDDLPFFYQAFEEYKTWLEESKLDTVIKASNITVWGEKNILVLDFLITNQRDWLSLCKSYKTQTKTSLRTELFSRMLFVFQLSEKEAGIRIRSKKSDHFVNMRYKTDSLTIHETVPKDIPNLLYFEIQALNGYGVVEGRTSLEHTKILFQRFIRYKFNSRTFPNVEVTIAPFNENTLNVHIKNVEEEVLKDKFGNFFEWLTIKATFIKEAGKIKIKYRFLGKYSYHFFKFRVSDYYDMYKHQKAYFEYYNDILKNELDEYIRTN